MILSMPAIKQHKTQRSDLAAHHVIVSMLGFMGLTANAMAKAAIDRPAGTMSHLVESSDYKAHVNLTAAEKSKKMRAGGIKDPSGTSEDDSHSNWDSFSEFSGGSVAKEITKGVRVEDIVEPPSDYRYASFGKQDPFIPPLMPRVTSQEKGPGSVEIPIVSALQRFPLDQLSIVGIWQLSNGERKAMVLTPSDSSSGSQGIIVKAGDPMGHRGGRILAIGSDFVTVREFFLAPDGVRQYEDRRLPMTITPTEMRPGRLVFKPGETTPKQVTDQGDVDIDQPASTSLPAPVSYKDFPSFGRSGATSESLVPTSALPVMPLPGSSPSGQFRGMPQPYVPQPNLPLSGQGAGPGGSSAAPSAKLTPGSNPLPLSALGGNPVGGIGSMAPLPQGDISTISSGVPTTAAGESMNIPSYLPSSDNPP